MRNANIPRWRDVRNILPSDVSAGLLFRGGRGRLEVRQRRGRGGQVEFKARERLADPGVKHERRERRGLGEATCDGLATYDPQAAQWDPGGSQVRRPPSNPHALLGHLKPPSIYFLQ